MSYVGKTMAPGERVLYAGRISLRPFMVSAMAFTVCTFGLGLIIYVPAAFMALIRQRCSEVTLTNVRIVVKAGLFARAAQDIAVRKIESVDLRQGAVGRLLNYGTIEVRGSGQGVIRIPSLSDPLAFLRALTGLLNAPPETEAWRTTADRD